MTVTEPKPTYTTTPPATLDWRTQVAADTDRAIDALNQL